MDVIEELERVAAKDFDPQSGRMFGHVYNAKLEDVLEIARRAYLLFMDKTMLDFTVYPSVLKLESDLVSFAAKLLNGKPIGFFTYGGTESVMLAMKAARDYYLERRSGTPEIVMPVTAHPCFVKAAEFLGMKVVKTGVDEEFRADVDAMNEAIGERTAAVVCSAPNYPFGCVDDVRAIAEIARGWLHVDACMGGFILPFLRKLGEKIPDFDFSVEGVYSISADYHKFGYAPRGASVVLYRSEELRKYQIFVNASWPGYPMVNTALLSTRSAGTLAAAWAVVRYLGEKGYLQLAAKVLEAREKIVKGLRKLGFEILGRPESCIVTFTSRDINVFELADLMAERGWYVQVQPGSKHLGFPKSIHLTIIPYHAEVADEFLADLEECTEKCGKPLEIDENEAAKLLARISLREGELPDLKIVNELIHVMPPETVEETIKFFVNSYIFKPKEF